MTLILFYFTIFYDILTNFSIFIFHLFFLLTGHSRQPAIRQEKGWGEIFNPPPLVSLPHTAPF
jgi:hypothetical protein